FSDAARISAGSPANCRSDTVCGLRAARQRSGRKERKTHTSQRYRLRVRYGAAGPSAAEVQCEVLSRGDALYPLRSRDRVYVSLGGGVPRGDQGERADLLEHAQLHFDLDGGLRLRAQEGRPRLQEIKRVGTGFRPTLLLRTFARDLDKARKS